MQELYEGIELTPDQTTWICKGLLDLASADGIDPSEMEFIQEFYQAETGNAADLSNLNADGFDLAAAAEVFKAGGPELVESFLMSAYMLIYADGHYSPEERGRIGDYADALDVDHAALEDIHLKARLWLLRMLADNLRNREAVKQVGLQNLGLDETQFSDLLED
jgi:DnaJ-domain-containing protein 1